MKILFLEPFFTGSHQYFAEGIQRESSHTIELLTLPGRFWKWRMRGASIEFSRLMKNKKFDLLIAGNLMDLAQLKALNPDMKVPIILYVHENQLDYPIKKGEERDFQYGWTDYTNMLCADHIIFNSAYNRDSFFKALDKLISRLPDCRPDRDFSTLKNKSSIIPPGCRMASSWNPKEKFENAGTVPLILWNHRWEHDKNPEDFFSALKLLKEEKIPFRLALLGESYKSSPECFQKAESDFKDELVHYGYLESRKEYEDWLMKSDVVMSTAIQENFGISIIEAAGSAVIPLLPNRLAYPEVLPVEFHKTLLYNNLDDLREKFKRLLQKTDISSIRKQLRGSVQAYSWQNIIKQFDLLFEETLSKHDITGPSL